MARPQRVSSPARGAPPPGKIARFEIFPVRYPATRPFRFLDGPRGPGRPAVFVKLTADDGTVGWGQSVPMPRWTYETLESAVIVRQDYQRPVVLGRDPLDLAGLPEAMNREICPSYSTGYPLTKAGVDLAVPDLIARSRGCNVAELRGRTLPPKLTVSWTVASKSLDDIPGIVDEGLACGFEHFNVKVAPDPAYDVKVCRLIQQRVPRGFLGSGLTDPDVSLAASLILFGAYDLRFPAALNGLQFPGGSVLTEPFVPVNGRLRIPQGPGLGVTVDEEKLADLVRRSNVMSRFGG